MVAINALVLQTAFTDKDAFKMYKNSKNCQDWNSQDWWLAKVDIDFWTCCTQKMILTDVHLFNGLFSRTTYAGTRKVKPVSIFIKQEMMGWQWHQLDHMQINCTSLQEDNHANTSSLKLSTGRMLYLMPSQQKQGRWHRLDHIFYYNRGTWS